MENRERNRADGVISESVLTGIPGEELSVRKILTFRRLGYQNINGKQKNVSSDNLKKKRNTKTSWSMNEMKSEARRENVKL